MKYTFVNIVRTDFGVYYYDIKHFDDLDEAKKHLRDYKENNLSKFGFLIKSNIFIEGEYEEFDLHQYDTPSGKMITQTVTLLVACKDDGKSKNTMKVNNLELYSVYVSRQVNSIITSQECHMANITLKEAIRIRHSLFENFLNGIKSNETKYRLENSSESERHCSVMYLDYYTNNINLWTCIVIRQDQLRGVRALGTM